MGRVWLRGWPIPAGLARQVQEHPLRGSKDGSLDACRFEPAGEAARRLAREHDGGLMAPLPGGPAGVGIHSFDLRPGVPQSISCPFRIACPKLQRAADAGRRRAQRQRGRWPSIKQATSALREAELRRADTLHVLKRIPAGIAIVNHAAARWAKGTLQMDLG